VLFVQSIAPD